MKPNIMWPLGIKYSEWSKNIIYYCYILYVFTNPPRWHSFEANFELICFVRSITNIEIRVSALVFVHNSWEICLKKNWKRKIPICLVVWWAGLEPLTDQLWPTDLIFSTPVTCYAQIVRKTILSFPATSPTKMNNELCHLSASPRTNIFSESHGEWMYLQSFLFVSCKREAMSPPHLNNEIDRVATQQLRSTQRK